MPTQPSPKSASTSEPSETPREAAFEKLLSGRLALQTLRSQLDQQAEQLRTQLVVNRTHERRIEEMLVRLDERLAKHHPDVLAILAGE